MKNETQNKHGYWVYSNGSSFWGLGVNLHNEIPLECPVEVHKEVDVAKKAEWHSNKLIELAKIKAEEEAKKKK